MALKNKLKEIRMTEYMMNASQFADKLNVKRSTYSRWELGDNNPSLEKAYEIAKILDKDLKEIWYE